MREPGEVRPEPSSPRRIAAAFTGLLLFLLAACTTAPPPSSVAAFGAALGATTSSYRAGLSAAQSVETSANRAVLMAKATCRDARCPPITSLTPKAPILSEDLLALQFAVLEGLEAYADLLASLTDAQTQTLVSQSVAGIGKSLQGLAGDIGTVTGKQLPGLDAATIQRGTTALGALGDFLVAEKLNAELPRIIEQNHPRIVAIADFLAATIGTAAPGKDKSGAVVPAHGLRAILAAQLEQIDVNAVVEIERLRRDARVGSIELAAFVGKAYDDNAARAQQTDAALAEIQAALRKLVTAHAALRAPSDPSTWQQIQSFIGFAQRARDAAERALGK